VNSRLHGFTHFLTALALGLAGTLAAQAQIQAQAQAQTQAQTPVPAASSAVSAAPAAPATPAAAATLHGQIADPTGALIPGAMVTITTPAGRTVSTTASSATGHYQVNGLAPGSYIVQAAFTGFAPFASQPIQLAAGQLMRVNISMALEVEQQSVVVTSESPTVNIEASENSSAIVIKGKDLDALSDDPDELSSELTALAGPSAGPNGGQIYIDGFTGGQLPPKSAIREIRINQNPFSSEFDKLGYGRIEILTKPGTDKLHGQFFAQGNDNVFNTGNPFISNLPSYHSYQFNGTLNGSLSKTASFFISAEQRNNQNDSIYSLSQAPILDTATNTYSLGPLSGGIFSPQTRTNIAPRIDLQLGQKNTLTLRYQFYRNNQSGNIGTTGLLLPSQATASTSIEHTVQLSDSEIINDHIVNETRFQYLRDTSSTTSASTDPMITVPGSFSGGGSSSQFSHDHTDHLELQNLTTMSVGAHAIKFGARLRDNRDANSTDANFNGSFTFPSVGAIVATENGFIQGETIAQIAASCPAELTQQGGCVPFKLDYTTGGKSATANVFDATLFVQDDWKANPFLTLSGGLRWETQNHISDHNDWAPRVAFAYALDGHKDKKQAKTVLRGGFGLFYDRFSISDELSAERFSGAANGQQQFHINNPACFTNTSLADMSSADLASCGVSSTSTSTIVQIAPSYHSPYIEQFGASLERQLTKTTTLTATYLHSFGVHQLVTRDSNAYEPGTYQYGSTTLTGTRPNASLGIVDQYYPEAVFKQNQLIVNINAKLTPKFGLIGFYNLTAANSDGGAGSDASNSYNLTQDYGRASFVARQMLFLMANYTGPWGIVFNPFLIAQAGKPFNIVTKNDLTGDNFFNNRPAYADTSLCTANSSRYVDTSYGCFDTTPANGYTPIPVNLGNGPAAVAVNLRVSRSFGIGPKLASASTQDNGGGPPPGGPPPGGGHGGPGGPGGGIAFGPGGFGSSGRVHAGAAGAASAGRKYTLTFNAQALNLFNNVNYGTPGGTVGAPNFNRSTSLAGGIFSTNAASRRIFFQAVFAF
jgi:hypothetical protein